MGRSFRRLRRQSPSDVPAAEEIALTPEPPASVPAALWFLAEAEIVAGEPIRGGSNYGFALVVRREDEARLAVYKPRRGEVPLWDFPDGTLYRRERAAYLLACHLGWPFVPPTVIRDGPYGIGSVQLYIDPDPSGSYERLRAARGQDIQRIAAL